MLWTPVHLKQMRRSKCIYAIKPLTTQTCSQVKRPAITTAAARVCGLVRVVAGDAPVQQLVAAVGVVRQHVLLPAHLRAPADAVEDAVQVARHLVLAPAPVVVLKAAVGLAQDDAKATVADRGLNKGAADGFVEKRS